MIAVFVSDEDGGQAAGIFADRGQTLQDFAAADARVNQHTRPVGPDKHGISGAAAREYADLEDERPLYFISFIAEFETFVQEMFVSKTLTIKGRMKARVYVSIKSTVLDPQGQTICSALKGLGHKEIAAVRQGKFFEIGIADGTPREQAAQTLDEIARDVLSNPVIEQYRVEILD